MSIRIFRICPTASIPWLVRRDFPFWWTKATIGYGSCHDSQSDILLLDDSLSAVDAKTEHAILETIKQERLDKTTIITAHRLSAIVHADLILVLEDGKIVERGRHQELLDEKGWYYDTYMMQQLEKEESDAL